MTEAGLSAPTAAPPSPWLISRRMDLFGLLGSVSVSWALFGAWWLQWLDTLQLTMLWIFVFHGPHFFGTWSRTLCDPSEYAVRGSVFRRSWLWFLAGPALVGLGLATGQRDIVLLFFFLAALWAFHHVAKQHFGFLALYRARGKLFDKRDFALTKYYLLFSLWVPVVILLTNTIWGLSGIPGMQALANHLGDRQAVILDWAATLKTVLTWAFWIAQAGYLASVGWKLSQGKRVSVPELCLVAASVSLTWFVTMGVLARATDPANTDAIAAYAVVPLYTVYHNIQYHCLIWHYNGHKYRSDPERRFGLASVVNKSLPVYFACGVAYTLVTIGIEYYGVLPARATGLGEVLAALIWGFSFQHYYLDQHIWHVSRDAELRQALRI